ncbi:hypothetical protein E5358_03300 [Palleniella muris]|uniref:Uncharacterized protein n=2 Tax=Palleniella muris TaxID=3038145 RepID=A0AC61QSF7_9BACT|nr:DKNYY domain-containing protein [Palleniella muris]TGX83296.1 hypothetical protein E5358_03300 [Palleniella muris]
MKSLIITLVLAIMFGAMPCMAQNDCGGHGERKHEKRHHRPHYYIGADAVFFGDRKVEGASVASFKVLNDGYAKDSWSVYFDGTKIKDASCNSFTVLGQGYAKDTWSVYYHGRKIERASSDSFQCDSHGYAHDSWNTYFRGRKVEK